MIKMKFITPVIFLFTFLLIPLSQAETTFFDNPNDAFIMGTATSTPSASSQLAVPALSVDGKRSCLSGYNSTQGKCVNVSSSNLNVSKKMSKSPINVSQTSVSQSKNEEKENIPEEIKEGRLTTNESSSLSSEDTKQNWRLYFVLVTGIALIALLIVCMRIRFSHD